MDFGLSKLRCEAYSNFSHKKCQRYPIGIRTYDLFLKKARIPTHHLTVALNIPFSEKFSPQFYQQAKGTRNYVIRKRSIYSNLNNATELLHRVLESERVNSRGEMKSSSGGGKRRARLYIRKMIRELPTIEFAPESCRCRRFCWCLKFHRRAAVRATAALQNCVSQLGVSRCLYRVRRIKKHPGRGDIAASFVYLVRFLALRWIILSFSCLVLVKIVRGMVMRSRLFFIRSAWYKLRLIAIWSPLTTIFNGEKELICN